MPSEHRLRRERRIGWIAAIVLLSLGAFAFLMMKFVIGHFRIGSGSMAPTIHGRDRVLVNRLAYLNAKPRVGDVAAYSATGGRFLHRIVAGPGDTIEMRDKVLFRNGRRQEEPYAVYALDGVPTIRTFGPVTVSDGEYFLLGDNRDNANDSRFRGMIAEDRIMGRMMFVLHVGNCDEGP